MLDLNMGRYKAGEASLRRAMELAGASLVRIIRKRRAMPRIWRSP